MLKQLQTKLDFNSIYLYSFILFAFALPLSRAAISFFIVFLPFIWFIEGNLKQKIAVIKSNRFLITLCIYVTYLTLSLLWTDNIALGLYKLRLSLYFLTIYVAYTALKLEDIDKIISAFLLGMFVSEITAYGLFFELWTIKGKVSLDPTPFMNHIDYSVFLAITSLLLLHKIFSTTQIKEKIIFLLFFFTVTGNLFLTKGRTGQIAFIVGLFVTVFLHFKFTLKATFIGISILITLFFTAYQMSTTFHNRSIQTYNDFEKIAHFNLNTSTGVRVAYGIATYNIFLQHPFGVGVGDYISTMKTELSLPNKYTTFPYYIEFMKTHHPHNQYFLILLQIGIIGLLLFLFLAYMLLILPVQNKELKNFSIIFFTTYFTACFSEPLLMKQFPLALFVLFTSLFVASTRTKAITS